MAETNPFEIPPQIRELTEKNIEQCRQFYDQWMQGVAQAMSMWSATPAGQAAPGLDNLRNRAVQFAKDNADAAFALAQELAQGPTGTFGRTKQLLNQSFSTSLQDHLHDEARLITISGSTNDFAEGLTAFLAKRKPTFSGK